LRYARRARDRPLLPLPARHLTRFSACRRSPSSRFHVRHKIQPPAHVDIRAMPRLLENMFIFSPPAFAAPRSQPPRYYGDARAPRQQRCAGNRYASAGNSVRTSFERHAFATMNMIHPRMLTDVRSHLMMMLRHARQRERRAPR